MPFDVFEQYAKEYDQWFVHHHDVYKEELSRIQTAMGDIKHPSLEIGVGSGRFAQPLGIPFGLEPARLSGLLARERGIEVIQGRSEQMPFPKHTFQTIILITALCFLDTPIETIREVGRILTPEGKLMVAFIQREGTIADTYKNDPEKCRFLSHALLFSRRSGPAYCP